MAKKLTITIHVNPAAAVRAGKSQCGACELVLSDQDLAQLTPGQRETLAKHVAKEKYPEPYVHRGGIQWGSQLGDDDTSDASIETLALLLDRREAEVQKQLVEFQAEKEEQQRFFDQRALDAIAEEHTETKGLDSEGCWCGFGKDTIVVPALLHVSLTHCSEAVRQQYIAERVRRNGEAERLRKAEVPKLLAAKAKREAEEAAKQAEYEEQYARLPESLRARYEAGFAKEKEIAEALQALWRADAGLGDGCVEPDDWYDAKKPSSLTDEQFAALQKLRRELHEDFSVEPMRIYLERAYRTATEDDDSDEIDRDGEVRIPDEDRESRLVAHVSWQRAGREVRVVLPLD